MGSTSDWDVMSDAAATLAQFGVEFEKRVVTKTNIFRRTQTMTDFQFLARGIALAGCGIGAGCALIAGIGPGSA